MRRFLAALHRYLGTGLCLMFAVWFASGMVMVFAGFPQLDEARRLRALPPLVIDGSLPSPAVSLAHAAARGRIRLGMLSGHPVYRFVDGERAAGVVDAATGRAAESSDPAVLESLAAAFATHGGGDWTTTLVETRDQWNVTSPALAQFPLRRFAAHDGAHTEIYVSSKTADVVQVTTRRERLAAWAGAIPHWIYPIGLRRHAAAWRWLVLAIAGLGTLGAVAGLVLGVWSWRPRRRRREHHSRWGSPYRAPWMRWHHTLGLVFGVFAFTWVGSGAWSLEPFRASPRARADGQSDLQIDHFVVDPASALASCRRRIAPRELELIQVGGHPYYLCRQSLDEARLVAADRTAAEATLPGLTERVLSTGGWLDRWLFRGLHCFDFPFLQPHSGAWYVVILMLCAAGLIFSVTGVAAATGWLGRVRRRRERVGNQSRPRADSGASRL